MVRGCRAEKVVKQRAPALQIRLRWQKTCNAVAVEAGKMAAVSSVSELGPRSVL